MCEESIDLFFFLVRYTCSSSDPSINALITQGSEPTSDVWTHGKDKSLYVAFFHADVLPLRIGLPPDKL